MTHSRYMSLLGVRLLWLLTKEPEWRWAAGELLAQLDDYGVVEPGTRLPRTPKAAIDLLVTENPSFSPVLIFGRVVLPDEARWSVRSQPRAVAVLRSGSWWGWLDGLPKLHDLL